MSGIDRILSGGPGQIILFDYLECKPVLSQVSKAMKTACERARDAKLPQQIELRSVGFVAATKAKVKKICNGEGVETVLARQIEATGRKMKEVDTSEIWLSIPHAPFEKIREMHASLLQEKDLEAREGLAERLLVCVHEADTQLETIHTNLELARQKRYAQSDEELDTLLLSMLLPKKDRPKSPGDDERNAAQETRDKLEKTLKQFIAQESLAKHSKQIISGQPANPQQPRPSTSQLVSAICAAQADLNLTKLQQARLDKASKGIDPDVDRRSRDNLLAREEAGVEAALEQDRSFKFLWRSIRQTLVERPNIPNLPAEDAPVRDIRAWMNENPQNFENCHWRINLSEHCPVLIREIGWLQGLKNFSCTGNGEHRLANLPDELVGPAPELAGQPGQPVGLQSLEELELEGHSFREIPASLQRLRALKYLSITRNEHPIREFPEWLDRRINGGILNAVKLWIENEGGCQLGRLNRLFGLDIGGSMVIENWNRQYAGLPHEDFTDIPFNVWFRENCSIPSIPLYAGLGVIQFGIQLANIGQFYREGWVEMTRALILPLLPMAALIGMFVLAFLYEPFLSVFIIAWIISCSSHLINPILNNVIEPLLELGLGDDRMVHVRDIPAEAEAAPAAQG